MKIRLILSLLGCLTLLVLSSCSKADKDTQSPDTSYFDTLQVPHSVKGWELYSWPAGNNWYYSILVGTDRIKTLQEVTTDTQTELLLIQVSGIDSLKAVLARFPENEEVLWIGKGWVKKIWGAEFGNLQLPPQTVVDQVVDYCADKKINMTVTF
jgi:hypothetical protein